MSTTYKPSPTSKHLAAAYYQLICSWFSLLICYLFTSHLVVIVQALGAKACIWILDKVFGHDLWVNVLSIILASSLMYYAIDVIMI